MVYRHDVAIQIFKEYGGACLQIMQMTQIRQMGFGAAGWECRRHARGIEEDMEPPMDGDGKRMSCSF
jgi:hypothetical protein